MTQDVYFCLGYLFPKQVLIACSDLYFLLPVFLFSQTGLSGSLIAVFSLAVLFEFMNSYHSYLGLPASKRYIAQDSTKTKRYAARFD